jgi:hypothetical protein
MIGSAGDSRIIMDEVFERFAGGQATILDLERLVEHAESAKLQLVQVTVRRRRNPHNRPVRLMGRSGPLSTEDRPIVRADERTWAAWWRVSDCRLWLRDHQRQLYLARAS